MDAPAEREVPPAQVPPAQPAVPAQAPNCAALSLDALRAYRAALQDEESRVSYWRRIIQARLDVVRAGSTCRAGTLDVHHLAPMLTDQRVHSGRTALVEILREEGIPPLPNLAELWNRQVSEDNPDRLAAFEADLAQAEKQLSTYRSALHANLATATDQLISRYREQPVLALAVLPALSRRSEA